MLQNKTTIDYMPVINHPVTELSTVQELLRLSKVVTDVIGQHYTICTFDFAIVMKALELHGMRKKNTGTSLYKLGLFILFVHTPTYLERKWMEADLMKSFLDLVYAPVDP